MKWVSWHTTVKSALGLASMCEVETLTRSQLRCCSSVLYGGTQACADNSELGSCLGNYLRQPRDMLQEVKVGRATHFFASLTQSHRNFLEAKSAYEKVLAVDPRHVTALGCLGIVYHMMDQIDEAIVKYHEVRGIVIAVLNYSALTFLL